MLHAAYEADAPEQLALAMAELTRRTEKISDPLRRTRVLEGVPLYREVLAASAGLR